MHKGKEVISREITLKQAYCNEAHAWYLENLIRYQKILDNFKKIIEIFRMAFEIRSISIEINLAL